MKVLISGPVEDEAAWQTLVQKVRDLNSGKHGPFDLLVVTPSAKGPQRPADLRFPIQAAIDSGIYGEHVAVQVLKSSEHPQEGIEWVSPSIDLLVTDCLPEGCGAPRPIVQEAKCAAWALKCVPRYHFCGGTVAFFQRSPYRNADKHVTRLVALGPVGSSEKWIHALNLEPLDPHAPEPPGTTPNPYLDEPSKATSSSKQQGSQQFFFAGDRRPAPSHSNKRQRSSNRNAPRNRIPPRQDCWFCLASSTCEQHLLAHIGEEVYLALPKGGVRKEHVLLVPISHEASFAQFIKDEPSLIEVTELQATVEKAFSVANLAVLYTDRSLPLDKAPQRHGYLEALPIPRDKIKDVETVLKRESQNAGLQFELISKGSNKDNLAKLAGRDDYLFVQTPDGKAYLHHVKKDELDDPRKRNAILSFGRILACNLMGCPERINWKSCVAPKQQETDWTKAMASVLASSSQS